MSLLSSMISRFTSFIVGSRLVDGGDCLALANLVCSYSNSITALAGGGQVGATPLTATFNEVDTAGAGGADSISLPQAIPGSAVCVKNATAYTIAVFGIASNPVTNAGDTIAAHASNTQQPTATGVTQATALTAWYYCFAAGKWQQFLSA